MACVAGLEIALGIVRALLAIADMRGLEVYMNLPVLGFPRNNSWCQRGETKR
jgi:hypothetical protein